MKSLTRTLTSGLLGAIILMAGLSSAPAMSQSENSQAQKSQSKLSQSEREKVADFYDDKTVTVVIRSTPGGGYDFYGRLIARHLGQYLPGNPEVIAVNRPGAGGLVATNYMYNRAPKDGTEILIPAREFALTDRLGSRGVRYETLEMPALGSVSQATRVWMAGPDVPVDNLEDLANFREKTGRDFRFAVSGKGAGSYQMARLLQEGGYPVDIIVGYEGTSDQTLAVLRGEADGTINTYTSARETIEDEGFKVITKLGTHPNVADVESVIEGLSGNEKELAEVLGRLIKVGRPFVTAPGVPPARLAALQEAFRKVVHDPDAQEEAKRAQRSLEGYVTPEEMTEAYQRLFDAPDEVLELLRTDTQ